jgi:hypothetical protein
MVKQCPEYGHKLYWLENADEKALQAAYASAGTLISTSYAEGFGLPLIEAHQHACQIIASDIPVFREVLQNVKNKTFFDPENLISLVSAIECQDIVSSSPEVRIFNWRESALELVSVLESHLQSHTSIIDHIPVAPSDVFQVHLEITDVENCDSQTNFTVKISNLSKQPLWGDDENQAVSLGIKLYDKSGHAVRIVPKAASVPFVILPDDFIYVSVSCAIANGQTIGLRVFESPNQWIGDELLFDPANAPNLAPDASSYS